MSDSGERDLLAEIQFIIILMMFLLCVSSKVYELLFSLPQNELFIFTSGAGPLYGGRHVYLQ